MWKPLDESVLDSAHHSEKITCICACGQLSDVRVSSLLYGETHSCKSCARRIRNEALSPEERVRIATIASAAAAEKLKNKTDPYKTKYGSREMKVVSVALVGARQRCENKSNEHYKNYGGRGIEFRFPSIRSGVEWVLDNIGPRPSAELTIDRIDNNRGYEPGNLRWATRTEQARNKRQYKKTEIGERIRNIMTQRNDLTYETIRMWLHAGLTDEEILGKRKYERVPK